MNKTNGKNKEMELIYERIKKTSELAIKGISNKVFYKLIKYKNKLKKSILLPEVKSILVIRIGSIGDVIRSTSVIENLSEIYNNTAIDILTSKECKIIYKNNPRIKNIYTLENIDCLDHYDWIINLQYFPPASNFLTKQISDYEIFLSKINKVPSKIMTGNSIHNGIITYDTNILYNETSQEQLYDIALLDWNENSINETKIYIDPNFKSTILDEIKEIKKKTKLLGLFLGSYSQGDYDNGFRTYSIDYILDLIEEYSGEYTIILFGLSKTKTEDEIIKLNESLKKYKNLINIIDKVSLEELIYIINEFNTLITSDSGPLHIGMALKIPTIGLFGNAGSFEISPKLENKNYSIINSFSACSPNNYERKFFCQECTKEDASLFNCKMHKVKTPVDSIPISYISKKIDDILDKI